MKVIVIPVTPFEQNCSLIWDPSSLKAAVVDPGGDIERIISHIRDNNLQVEKILLTHGHLDHVGGTQSLAAALNVPVIGPQKDDMFWLQSLDKQSEMFGFANVPNFTPDQWLEDGEQLHVGNIVLQVIHCPGHTPGHVVFYAAQHHVMIVGDVLFKGSIGRTDFPRGNHQQLLDSIRNKLFPLGDDILIYPGHGPTTTLGHERHNNPFVADTKFG